MGYEPCPYSRCYKSIKEAVHDGKVHDADIFKKANEFSEQWTKEYSLRIQGEWLTDYLS